MAETINIKDIEERLKNRKIGTIDWYKFFSVAIPLIETDKGLSMLFEIRSS